MILEGPQEFPILFWGFLVVIIVQYTPRLYSNYEGPTLAIRSVGVWGSRLSEALGLMVVLL